ncbi:hypothetical protein ZIOFF_001613 [Zingiber officinale]|uniref:ABC transmembrane type-1 domain-containing protein n=1 Tax=Zingiber officinale TaxID=94328 RepID=A0A8J5IK78_ZINOF|nr:hypothetical protein ZIOFF_001613 [Zingiber officinale]
MEHLREICKCLKTLVTFLLCHCDSLPKHDPKPWDPPFDPSQLKIDPPLAIARRRLPLRCYCSLISLPPCMALKIAFLVWLYLVEAFRVISYIRTLYAFTNDTLAKYSYATSLQATLRYGILISLVQGLGLGFTYGLDICSCALQLWVGRSLISNGKDNGGEIITSLFAVILSGLGLNQAATNFYSFEQGRIAAYRLFELISRSNSSLNQDRSTLATMQGNIEFRNVYFSYLSCEVLLNGENIKHLKLEWLRSQIGLVTQEPTLLSLRIKDNIDYGRSATSDQIEEAAKIVHAHNFITSLEMGYETQVTSGLDFEVEKAVQEALDILIYMTFALDSVKSLQVLSMFCICVTEIPVDLF